VPRLALVDTELFGAIWLYSMIKSCTLTRHYLHLQKSRPRLAEKADESEAQDDVLDDLNKALSNAPIKIADMGEELVMPQFINLLANKQYMAGEIPGLDFHLPDWQIGPPQSRL
jgi:hypothetical protein